MDVSARAIYNPVQRDTAVFLKTVDETGGAFTLIEVEVAPGGGVGEHFHTGYTETFECMEGEVNIQQGKKIIVLKPGDKPVVTEKNTLHRFFNTSNKASRFTVLITPGCRGFEEGIQIAYGLARDGKTDRTGTPRRVAYLGILLLLTQTKLPGWQGMIEKGLRWMGRRAERRGVTDELRRTYVKI
ncbi:MAG: cupin domain-containing protein [Ferruginibacter sp.]|nr:cupin domain-containing protein [Ferruginibacter sp.]